MAKYELVKNAGEVPYEEWAASGVEVPIFDKDGVLTEPNRPLLVDGILEALRARELSRLFKGIGIASNNHDALQVDELARTLEAELGIGVIAVSRAHEYNRKPHPEMGIRIASELGVEPNQLGVIGDRRYTDVGFGMRLGAAKIALCEKAGEGDANFVPIIRRLEKAWVAMDRRRGLAA